MELQGTMNEPIGILATRTIAKARQEQAIGTHRKFDWLCWYNDYENTLDKYI